MLLPFLAFFSILATAQSSMSYISAFSEMQSTNSSIWPCPSSYGGDFLSSTFGPRIKLSTSQYDFHAGVDISGNVGDLIVAPYGGVVEKSDTYAKSGHTLILVHTLPGVATLLGKSSLRFYTVFMHLEEILVQPGDIIERGEIIGKMGMTGHASFPHLHFEVRLETRCSLVDFDNPSTKCNTCGYDFHISPMLILPLTDAGGTTVMAEYLSYISDSVTKVVRVNSVGSNPSINAYKVSIVRPGGQVRDSYVLDSNQRVDFDVTSTSTSNTPNMNAPFLEPVMLRQNSESWNTFFRIPKSWFGTKSATEKLVVEILDIWGQTVAVTSFGLGPTWC